jgi:hypothetical protein
MLQSLKSLIGFGINPKMSGRPLALLAFQKKLVIVRTKTLFLEPLGSVCLLGKKIPAEWATHTVTSKEINFFYNYPTLKILHSQFELT